MITMLNLTWTMNMVPWKGTPFTNRGILLFRVVFSCQLNGIQLFFLQNLETSLLLKPLGVCEIHVPPLETSPNKVKLIWIDFMIDSIWFELIWFSYYHHVRPLFSGGCFFFEKKHTPQKTGEVIFISNSEGARKHQSDFHCMGFPSEETSCRKASANIQVMMVLLMEEILHRLGCIKPCK